MTWQDDKGDALPPPSAPPSPPPPPPPPFSAPRRQQPSPKPAPSISVTTARSDRSPGGDAHALLCICSEYLIPGFFGPEHIHCAALIGRLNVLGGCFDWPPLRDSVPVAFSPPAPGGRWPHGAAYQSTSHSPRHHRGGIQNESLVVFPQKCLISDLRPLSLLTLSVSSPTIHSVAIVSLKI